MDGDAFKVPQTADVIPVHVRDGDRDGQSGQFGNDRADPADPQPGVNQQRALRRAADSCASLPDGRTR